MGSGRGSWQQQGYAYREKEHFVRMEGMRGEKCRKVVGKSENYLGFDNDEIHRMEWFLRRVGMRCVEDWSSGKTHRNLRG